MSNYVKNSWRKMKRFERGYMDNDPVQNALYEGEWMGLEGKPYKNRYPKGKRHDAFKQGYNLADPMGEFHGRNE